MHRKRSISCFLFGYLVLLLNFGPSLHRADFLGLHSSAPVQVGEELTRSSCCCDCHSHSAPVGDGSTGSLVVGSDHDCAFCRFFDQFHAAVAVFDEAEVETSASLLSLCEPDEAIKVCFVATARGPPIS
jgi:hypothetical protein